MIIKIRLATIGLIIIVVGALLMLPAALYPDISLFGLSKETISSLRGVSIGSMLLGLMLCVIGRF